MFSRLISHSCFRQLLSQTVAEFDLRTVNYEVKSPKCHELSLVAPPRECISFNFCSEKEAHEWATVVMSSLREARRGQSPILSKKHFMLDGGHEKRR